ncbi:hypothetical protein ACJ41O_006822 [Fusarium nematophilum]
MEYDYEQPRNEVFDFFIYSFLSSVVFLVLTGRKSFKKSLNFQYLITACVNLAAYIFPATILFRVAIYRTPKSLSIPRILLLVEFGLCVFFFLCNAVTLVLKHFHDKTRALGLMDLHEHAAELSKHPWLWWKTMAYLCFRFVILYVIHLPICLTINIIFLALFNPPHVSFNDILFLVSFGIVLMAASVWMWTHIGAFQAIAHSELVVNSFVLTYFASDNEYLAKMLLSSLSIYLVSFYSIIAEPTEPKPPAWYAMPSWFYFQVVFWFHYKDVPIEEFKKPGFPSRHGKIFANYHDLLYNKSPAQPRENKPGPEDKNPLGT